MSNVLGDQMLLTDSIVAAEQSFRVTGLPALIIILAILGVIVGIGILIGRAIFEK